MLTDRIKDLIARARIVSFANWTSIHPATSIEIFQAAEDRRVYLTDEDYAKIAILSPQTSQLIPIAELLRDHVVEIVDEARSSVMAKFPDIDKPGGSLYPAERAEACWRDFWHYLRPVTYGLAGGQSNYTSVEGFRNMQSLYQELEIPIDAMTVGLEGLKTASLKRIDPQQWSIVIPYFDHLITQLRAFASS